VTCFRKGVLLYTQLLCWQVPQMPGDAASPRCFCLLLPSLFQSRLARPQSAPQDPAPRGGRSQGRLGTGRVSQRLAICRQERGSQKREVPHVGVDRVRKKKLRGAVGARDGVARGSSMCRDLGRMARWDDCILCLDCCGLQCTCGTLLSGFRLELQNAGKRETKWFGWGESIGKLSRRVR
jgi:hypothetical protein